jgi:transcriptional regulator with XRE-family HTH domain
MRKIHECAKLAPMPNNIGESGEAIAARLILLREALGYRQADFARRLGISYQRLSNWERNVQPLPLSGAQNVRRVTGATLDWLYNGIEAGLPRDLADLIAKHKREPGNKRA